MMLSLTSRNEIPVTKIRHINIRVYIGVQRTYYTEKNIQYYASK